MEKVIGQLKYTHLYIYIKFVAEIYFHSRLCHHILKSADGWAFRSEGITDYNELADS
jgi:hypothetical protein